MKITKKELKSELFSDFTNCKDAVEHAKSSIEATW